MTPIIIGLCGNRQVGKSRAARHLVEVHGFQRLHPFDGGKAASRGYFQHLGADETTALRMTDGDLKDLPSPLLPVIEDPRHGTPGTHYAPRFWLEKFGKFMGMEMGPAWTLEREIERNLKAGQTRLISESIVFEIESFRRMGGIVIRLDRPRTSDEKSVGFETDSFTRTIVPDHVILNDSDFVEDLHRQIDLFLEDRIGLRIEEPEPLEF